MGLRNAFVRSGKYGKSQASSSTGFSASRYYSRNAASAGSFMAPVAPTSAASQPLDTRRPYSGVGKTSVNLFGRPVSPPSQELKEMPGAFEGVPVLGTIADGLAGLGSLPIPLEYVPGFGSLGTTRTAAKQEAALHPTEFAEFARKQATEKGVSLEENWATDMRLMTDFARQQFIAKGNSELAAAAMFTPTDDTVGGAFEALLRGLSAPQQAFQRTVVGAGLEVGPVNIGNSRVEDLLTRSDADLEGNAQLIAIRDDYKNGRITRDTAIDRLILEGHGMTDPLGQSGPVKFIRSIGDNTPLDVPFDVVANAVAAAASLGLEVGTDPTTLISIGTGTATRLSLKGTAKGIAALTRNAGERGVAEALESGALKVAKTADGLETAAASEIRNAAARAEFDRIRQLVPEGLAATDENILRAGIRAKDPAVLEALRSTSIIERPFVSNEHVLKWMKNVENVMDPLTLFGRDRAGRLANKAVALHLIDGGTNQLGKHNIGPVMEALEKIGVSQERSGGDLGTAFANIGEQIGGEHLTRLHVKLGIGMDDAMDPVALSDLGSDMLSRHGRDVASMVKHKIAKVALLVVPREGESMASALVREQEMVADLLVKMYDGVDIGAALAATRGMNAEQLAVVRFMQYGNMADNLLNARALSASEAAAMGLSPDFVGRVIFLGPTQLTRGKAGELYKLIKKKDYAAIRQMVEKYDLLEWNISLGQDDAGLIKDLRRFLDNHVDNLPAAIDPKSMTPAMQAFKDKFGDSMELGLRGENVFQTGRNADGRIVSIDPFMDYVRGAAIGPGDVAPGNVVQRNVRRMLRGISGQHIIIEQNRRFAQRMSQEFGVNREQTDAMLSLARTMANQHKAASPRGLSQDLLYESAMAALPKRWKTKIGSRELQRAIFFAMEGSTSTVGLTQKFTGKIKAAEVNRFGTNYAGTLSEWLYPNAKFRWSLFFQLQEGIETPVLLIARGMASPQQFTGPLTGTRAGAGAALRAGRGGRRAAFRKARTRSVEEARDLEYQTAVMMDAFVGGVRYEGDMIEMTNIMRRGSAAAAAAASTREGRALASLVNDSKIARLKTRGQLISFRHQVGNDMARMLQRESPASWATARGYYNTSGDVSDAEVAIRWFNDLLMRNNPDSAFSAVKAHRNPAEFFRPGFLGRRTRWSEDIVLEGLSGELDNPNISFKQLRKRYLDPEDDVVTEQWLDERLRALGADENYIQRTKWRMDYPTEKEWEAKILELTGDPEMTAKHMEAHRLEAAQEGLPLIESLADKYHGPPQVLDENGEWKDTTLFQLTADLLDSRGLPTVSMTHPDVVVGGTMAQIGQRVQTDISLPPAVGALEWESHALAQHTEMVPMSLVAKMEPGNALRVDEKELAALAADIKSNGMREPIQLTYYAGSRTVVIGEGNHRTAAMLQLYQSNPAALRGEHIPVTVFRYEGSGPGTKVPGKDPDEFGYTPGNMRPSDIGVGNAESAAVIRHDAALLRETKVKDLTPAEKKGREYQQVRVTRTADPDLGRPKTILEMGGDGRLVARNADGKVTHRIGGHKTPTEWVEELEATMTNDAMREHSRWYIDMRRAFLALSDNQQEEATHLLMAFGITQLNTSPVAGMKYMLHIVESVRRGGEMPADIKQLQKVAGLNGSALKHFMEQGYVSEKGMGQKLIDFVDSLIGVNGRTVPVRGPNGTWTAVAGDIWAKRDVGYVDGKMLKHLQHAYGRQYEVKAVGNRLRKNKDTGEMEEVADTFQFTDRETGQSFRLDPAEVKGNPTSLEYDAIVEFYNDAADHLNEIGFLDRKDWVAAEAQALGWFKAKKVYNDPTGDPRTALTESMWNTRVDVMPSSTAVMSEMYPEVAEHTGRAIAGETGHQFSDEAERISGVQVMSSYGSVRRTTDGRLGAATNFEVLASPDGVRLYMATLGTVSHNARVRATRATLTKPTKANGVRPMVELTFPPSMSPQDMDGAFKALAEDSEFFGDADLVQRADGTWAIRVVAEPGESEAKFAARLDDNTLRDYHAGVSSPEGYGRGRYINPDKPMAPGAREQGIRDRGDAVLARSMEDPKPITWTDENLDDLADSLWQAVKRPDGEDDWNGLTILSHSGEKPKAHGTFEGDGPFSTGVGTTVSLPLDVTEAEFKQAVRDFVETNRVYLERQKGAIGVFRDLDPDHMRIDLDANLIVDDIDDVEAVQLVLGREGGAYDFSAGPEGNGVYLPQFDPRRANSIERGYADVIEMDNDWAANPNGEGYTAHIKKPRRFEEDTDVVAEAKARVKGAKGLAQTKVGWNDGIEESFRRTGDLKVPERANTVYRKQKGVLLAYDGEGNLVGSLMYAAEPGSYGVLNIMSRYPRQGTATRLYDEALALDGDEFIKAIGQTSMTPEGKKFASAWLKKQKKQTTEVRRGELEQAARELEREGVQWGRMVWEKAYQRVAGREVAAHRVRRNASGDTRFDVSNPTGYLQSSPRGTRAARFAIADDTRSRRLFQRTPGGRPAGAITDAGTALSTTPAGRRPRRAQLYVHPKRKQGDTLLHEYAHDFINRLLHESGRRRAKAVYAGREGTLPTPGSRTRSHVLTVDEQEWLADQLIEYLRQGPKAVAHPSLVPLAEYYSKTLKAKRRRVEPDLTEYTAREAEHAEAMTAYEARRAAHDTERARQLSPAEAGEFGPLPEGATEVPSGRTDPGPLWDELQSDFRAGRIQPGESKSIFDVGLSDEDYVAFKSRYAPFIEGDTITLPAERPPAPPMQRRYLTAEKFEEGYTEAQGAQAAIKGVHQKWDQRGTKNNVQMEKDLNRLEEMGVDTSEEMGLLEEYNDLDRADFSDAEEYQDMRNEVWDQLLDTLDTKQAHYLEDLGFDEATAYTPGQVITEELPAAGPPPVDIGEFGEAAPTPPVRPRAKSEVVTLHPDAKALFDTIDKSPKPKNAYAYDVEEENVLKWMYASHRRADRSSKDLIHFKGERSWLERSLNHPYFGMYPLSYMWGKILPEMVEFMLFRPFGVKAPGVALNYTNKMYQHTMNAMENDPELRAWMAENEEALRAISMLSPGVPWDMPVNTPLPVRRYIEGVATNLRKDMDGEQPEEYGAWEAFVADIDWARTASDTIGYTFGPKTGTETLLSYPGLIGKVLGGMQPTPEEELAKNPQFIPPTVSGQPQPVAPPPPQVGQPSSRVAPTDQTPDDVAELTDLLGEEYAEVANRIAGGG